MIRLRLLAAILTTILVGSAACILAADGSAIAFVPPAPASDGSVVDADADTISLPVPVAEDAGDGVDAAAAPVEPGAEAEAVPKPKATRPRAFEYRTPLPTEMPVIWPQPVGPVGPAPPFGSLGPAGPVGPVWPRVLGPLDELQGFEEPLWPCVRYEDRQNIAPHAVPQIVAVKHPGAPRDRKGCCLFRGCFDCEPDTVCGDCGPEYVLVEICVPRCGCPEFDIKRDDHSKIEFDFGDYEVEITSKNGWIDVDYDD